MKARKFFLVVFTLMAILVGSALVANAAASVSEVSVYCTFAQASGTSTAPYVTFRVYYSDTFSSYHTVVPVTGGTWSASVSFPEYPVGTTFYVQAFGSTAPIFDGPTYYDGEAFFEGFITCEEAPVEAPEEVPVVVTCSNPLPADAVVYTVPNGATAYFNPDLQSGANFSLPAGSWKISEVSGDFAKVWIACEAESIWIPSSAIGEVVG